MPCPTSVSASSSPARATSPKPSASAGRSCSPASCPTTSPRRGPSSAAPWWRQVYGADWRHPDGPQSDVDGPRGSPGGPRLVVRRRRRSVAWSGHAPAHRGGVGVRRRRRLRRDGVPVGRRARTRRRAPHERVPGHVPRRATPPPTAGPARRPWIRSRPTGSGSTTSPATCGSGAPTGSSRTTTPRARAAIPTGPPSGHASGHARRVVPVPPLLLPALPRVGAQRQHARQLDGQPRLPRRRRASPSRRSRSLNGIHRSAAAMWFNQARPHRTVKGVTHVELRARPQLQGRERLGRLDRLRRRDHDGPRARSRRSKASRRSSATRRTGSPTPTAKSTC